jgi:hypothetical protein
MAVLSYVSHCSENDKGDTVEILVGTAQEVVDAIKTRRLSYGNVEIRGLASEVSMQGSVTVIITYRIVTA